jgi:hypothetical protein
MVPGLTLLLYSSGAGASINSALQNKNMEQKLNKPFFLSQQTKITCAWWRSTGLTIAIPEDQNHTPFVIKCTMGSKEIKDRTGTT